MAVMPLPAPDISAAMAMVVFGPIIAVALFAIAAVWRDGL
jgi:hypothetical protein